ncbi:hypothetical protein CLAFUR0_14596 [Fulvia fulva]|nr:hypothetical protein CLAFUR0_14596 [Fulvia fulva]
MKFRPDYSLDVSELGLLFIRYCDTILTPYFSGSQGDLATSIDSTPHLNRLVYSLGAALNVSSRFEFVTFMKSRLAVSATSDYLSSESRAVLQISGFIANHIVDKSVAPPPTPKESNPRYLLELNEVAPWRMNAEDDGGPTPLLSSVSYPPESETHEAKPYLCTRLMHLLTIQCNQKFANTYHLARHENIMHEGVPAQCPYCKISPTLLSRSLLERHRFAIHPQEQVVSEQSWSWRCAHTGCSSQCASHNDLLQHEREVHGRPVESQGPRKDVAFSIEPLPTQGVIETHDEAFGKLQAIALLAEAAGTDPQMKVLIGMVAQGTADGAQVEQLKRRIEQAEQAVKRRKLSGDTRRTGSEHSQVTQPFALDFTKLDFPAGLYNSETENALGVV